MTEQRLGCEEQMKPAAPSVVKSGGAEAVKLEATDPIVAATLNFSFWSVIIVLIIIAVEYNSEAPATPGSVFILYERSFSTFSPKKKILQSQKNCNIIIILWKPPPSFRHNLSFLLADLVFFFIIKHKILEEQPHRHLVVTSKKRHVPQSQE